MGVEIMDLRPLPSKTFLRVLQPCTTFTIFPTKLADPCPGPILIPNQPFSAQAVVALLWYPMMMTKKMATDILWLVVLEVLVILHFQPKEKLPAPFLLPIANKNLDFLLNL